MKRSELGFTLALVPTDLLALCAAGIGAFYARFHPIFTDIRPVIFDLTPQGYLQVLFPMIVVTMLVYMISGLYSTRRIALARELSRILIATSAAMAVIFAITFFSRTLFESRFIAVAAWGLAIVFVSLARLGLRALQRTLLHLGIGVRRVAVIGNDSTTQTLLQFFETHGGMGFHVVTTFPKFTKTVAKEIIQLRHDDKIDEVLLAEPDTNRSTTLALVSLAESIHIDFRYAADLFSAAVGKSVTHMYAGVPVIEVQRTPLDGWGAIYKRVFDVVGALFLITVTSPLMLLVALAIIIETGFPIIFKNERVGKHGTHFSTLKFRSMRQEFSIGSQKSLGDQKKALELEQKLIEQKSKKAGPVYKILNDPRITPVGSFIRKFSLDELPQFFNVLMGSMSLVGPRPHQPREVAQYQDHHKRVLSIRPGITGMAQISGRSDLDFEDEIRLDTYYIEHWSPWLDLYILLKTPLAVFLNRGAY